MVLLALVPAALGVPTAFAYAANPQNLPIMPSYWFGPLDWLKTNSSANSLVFTWWDYGYYVSYWGQRVPVIDNGYQPDTRVIDVAKTIIGSDSGAATSIMAKYVSEAKVCRAYYLITSDELALTPIIRYAATFNLTTGANSGIAPVPEPVLSNSLYYKLFYANATLGDHPVPGFQLAYQNSQVRIYNVSFSAQIGDSIQEGGEARTCT
jgi:asparagine N-glycosylation enzyme membrane subunit Stt3